MATQKKTDLSANIPHAELFESIGFVWQDNRLVFGQQNGFIAIEIIDDKPTFTRYESAHDRNWSVRIFFQDFMRPVCDENTVTVMGNSILNQRLTICIDESLRITIL